MCTRNILIGIDVTLCAPLKGELSLRLRAYKDLSWKLQDVLYSFTEISFIVRFSSSFFLTHVYHKYRILYLR